MGERAPLPHRIVMIAIYLALNMSINLLNKFIISRTGFAFPLAVSLAHMCFCMIALLPLMLSARYRSLHTQTFQKSSFGLAVISVSFAANLALNNYSLTRLSLSLNQMIRASIPVVTVMCSIVIERTMPTRREVAALVAITVGVCAVLAEDVHANARGVAACVLSTVANGLMMSMSGFLLQDRLDVWRLAFYQAPVVVIALSPAYFYSEHARVREYLTSRTDSSSVLTLVLLTCFIALAYNAVHSIVITLTSATTTTVIGQGKILALMCLSAILLGERDFFDWRTVCGGSIAFLGFAMYSFERNRINETRKK